MVLWAGAPRCALDKITTEAIAKTITKNGNDQRSKMCTKLWPKKATAICSTTMITRQSALLQPSSALSAKAPLTLFTANQPTPATSELIPAGRMLPRKPKPSRDRTIWGTPYNGPRAARKPMDTDPSPVPSTIASVVIQNERPKNQTPMIPTKMVANSMFGETQVQNC